MKGFVPVTPITSRDLASTRPTTLHTPPPLNPKDYPGPIPLLARLKQLRAIGLAYVAFYKTGLWNLWENYKALKTIRTRIGKHTLQDVVQYGIASPNTGEAGPLLSRTDYQVAVRTKHDLRKLVPFSIVFIICGEFTPLVVYKLGSAVVPYTCRVPTQEQGDFLRPVKTQATYTRQMEKLLAEASEPGAIAEWKQEFLEAYRLNANPFSSPFVPVLARLWHIWYARPRLRQHCEEVLCDTILICREGGFEKLPPREVFLWSLKYGLPALTKHLASLDRQGVPIDPDSLETKEKLLPAVKAEAASILDVDWSRLRAEDRWRAVLQC